jgi:hypothetical protein
VGPGAPGLTGRQLEKAMLRVVWYLHQSRRSRFYHRHHELPGRQITIPISAGGTVVQKRTGWSARNGEAGCP